ncbi:MAG: hypothetical protein ABIE42_05710 [Candidatus Eisenbacteria bacterium]
MTKQKIQIETLIRIEVVSSKRITSKKKMAKLATDRLTLAGETGWRLPGQWTESLRADNLWHYDVVAKKPLLDDDHSL